MTKRIDIDNDVWTELQRHAKPLEDDVSSVLRRVLGISQPRQAGDRQSPDPGYLHPYIRSGVIAAGTRLTWHRPRVGVTHHATVTETGRLVVDGHEHHPESPFKSPSGAAKVAANKNTDGWNNSWQLPDGRPLGAVRDM